MTRARKIALLAGVTLAAMVCVAVFVPPLPQDPGYHAFADQRVWFGIPHAGDVVTNIAFVAVGLWGLVSLSSAPIWRLPYGLFMAGVTLTGLGSAYYHWHPSDATLLWDRLPMSVAFMSLVAALVADRIGQPAGRRLLAPLILAGLGSVLIWHFTGDLRAYAVAQFLPLLVLPLLCWLLPPVAGLRGGHIAVLYLCYGLAKGFEAADGSIWEALGHTVSGHNLKHLAAAAGCLAVVAFIRGRQPAV